jgi:hypothetical protein
MKKLFHTMLAGLFALALSVGCGDGSAEEPETDVTTGAEDDFGAPAGDDFGAEPEGEAGGDDEGMDDF